MDKLKKFQTVIIPMIVIAIVIGLSELQQGNEEIDNVTVHEKIIKVVVLFLILAAIVSYLIIPKTRMAEKIRMTERVYTATSVAGIICAVAGLVATGLWPEKIVELHLFELIFIAFALMYGYWGLIMKIRQAKEITDILDEKQIENIRSAAATTWAIVTWVFLIFFFASTSNALQVEGRVWFLVYFFSSLLVFSVATIYYFKWE
jgi:uncharacterized protein YacL